MTDSTVMDTYEASASDCIATRPPLLSSRKPQHRKLHSRNSPYYKCRQESYQRRRIKRIRNSDYPELSSSDECDPPPPLSQDGLPNPHFLQYMPRPSDIVPAIEEGSASDAGFGHHARQIHKRRVEATRILLSSIGTKGRLMPVPHWKRNRSGLSKYTTFMNPPQEDKNLPNLRVPPQLLSRFYRGSLLTVHRVGKVTMARKKDNCTNESPEASAFECEYLGSSSRSDFEVSEPRAVAKSEPQEIVEDDNTAASLVKGSGKDSTKDGFVKAAFLEELEKVAGGSSDSVSDSGMENIRQSGVAQRNGSDSSDCEEEIKVPAKPKGQTESPASTPDEVQEISKPEKKSEFDLFLEELSRNDELLFEERKSMDKEALVVKSANIEEEVIDGTEKDGSSLTDFQKDKRLSMMFSHNTTTKRPRSIPNDMIATYLQPSKRHKHGGRVRSGGVVTTDGTPDSRMNLKFTMKLMNKMGFTGRLGKREDGRKDPLLPTRHSFRSGLGSRPAQIPARKGDQSLLPTKFKGKAVENGMPSGSSNTPVATTDDAGHPSGVVPSMPNNNLGEGGGGDVYTRRRKRSMSTSPKESRLDHDSSISGANGTTAVEKGQIRKLDDADTYETDEEDNGVDNGRRAILIDIDALIKDSAERRLRAIEKVLSDASLTLNVKRLLETEPRDLCETELLRKVLGHANVKPSDMDDFRDKLDAAFESLPLPELEMELFDTLRQYSKDVHFGIFHRGSRRRLQYDLKETGLTNSFLHEVCVIVNQNEKWPHLETWQDLTCRVGVGPRQCLYILNQTRVVKCKNDWRPSMGVVAGACLGAQTAVWEKVENGVKLFIKGPMQKERMMKINNLSGYRDRRKVFDELLKNRMPVLKRRRVLAQYEDDLLWYSAVVQYEGAQDGKCWIRFNKFENTEWVYNEDLVSLCRRDFRKMKQMDFPGLIDSDASIL